MKIERSTEIKVGVVTLVSLIILVIGIGLGGDFSFSSKQKVIKMRFSHSGGIKPTSPVVVNGVKRGSVKEILNDNNTVLITATIDAADEIFSDASAKISILEITGGKKIEINPGKSGQKFDIAREMPGSTSADIGDLVGLVSNIGDDAKILIKRLDTISSHVNNLLADGSLQTDLKTSMSNLATLSTNANTLIKDNYADIQTSLKNLKVLTSDLKNAVQKHEPTVGTILEKINVTVSKTNNLITQTDTTIANANKLILEVNSIASDLKSNKSLISRMLYDKEMAYTLDSAVARLSHLVKFINDNGINVNVRLGTRP